MWCCFFLFPISYLWLYYSHPFLICQHFFIKIFIKSASPAPNADKSLLSSQPANVWTRPDSSAFLFFGHKISGHQLLSFIDTRCHTMLSIGLIPLFSYSVFCSFQFSEVPLTSFVRLLLFSAFFVFSYKAFLFRLIDLLLFFFSGFFFVLLPILIEHFLFTLISVHISFDSDVFYTCFLSNIRRSPLRLRWTVPPFLRL